MSNAHPLVTLAFEIATEAHAGQFDKSGSVTYINHPIEVAAKLAAAGYDFETIATGLLHDVIEDSDFTAADLVARGIPFTVAEAVGLLSKPNGMNYGRYVAALLLTGNIMAIRVKLADLTHNLERTRALPDDHPDKARLLRKYEPAFVLIDEALEEV